MLHRSLTLETREIGLLQTSTQVRISQQRIPQATLAESAKKNMVIALRKITRSKNIISVEMSNSFYLEHTKIQSAQGCTHAHKNKCQRE